MTDDVVAKNDALTERVENGAVPTAIAKVLGRPARTARILAVVVVVNAVLTICITVGGLILRNTVHDVERNTSQVEQNRRGLALECRVGNASDAKQLKVWNHRLKMQIAAARPEDKATMRALRDEFVDYVRGVFVPRDCNVPLKVVAP